MNKYIYLLTILIILTGCGSSSWIQKNPVFYNSGVYLESMDTTEFNIAPDRLLPEIVSSLKTTVADSMGRATLQQMITAYEGAQITSAFYTTDTMEASYILRVEEVNINWVPTANVAHPGPNYRIRIQASGWMGSEKVFETTQSDYGNLAFVAGGGQRFYIPSEEDKVNSDYQKETIYPALRTAFGKVWQEFLQAGRRM